MKDESQSLESVHDEYLVMLLEEVGEDKEENIGRFIIALSEKSKPVKYKLLSEFLDEFVYKSITYNAPHNSHLIGANFIKNLNLIIENVKFLYDTYPAMTAPIIALAPKAITLGFTTEAWTDNIMNESVDVDAVITDTKFRAKFDKWRTGKVVKTHLEKKFPSIDTVMLLASWRPEGLSVFNACDVYGARAFFEYSKNSHVVFDWIWPVLGINNELFSFLLGLRFLAFYEQPDIKLTPIPHELQYTIVQYTREHSNLTTLFAGKDSVIINNGRTTSSLTRRYNYSSKKKMDKEFFISTHPTPMVLINTALWVKVSEFETNFHKMNAAALAKNKKGANEYLLEALEHADVYTVDKINPNFTSPELYILDDLTKFNLVVGADMAWKCKLVRELIAEAHKPCIQKETLDAIDDLTLKIDLSGTKEVYLMIENKNNFPVFVKILSEMLRITSIPYMFYVRILCTEESAPNVEAVAEIIRTTSPKVEFRVYLSCYFVERLFRTKT
jgi:hypothetical protein